MRRVAAKRRRSARSPTSRGRSVAASRPRSSRRSPRSGGSCKRNPDRHREEIGAKTTGLHRLVEPAVGSADPRAGRPARSAHRRPDGPRALAARAGAPSDRAVRARQSRRGRGCHRRRRAADRGRSSAAPEKEPRLSPKSSASSSDVGRAPQLMATNAPLRADSWWAARAISSLPVPVSPTMRMGSGDAHTCAKRANCSPSAGRTVPNPAARARAPIVAKVELVRGARRQ